MYFWNVDALARDLKDNKVTMHEQFYYFIGLLVFVFFCVCPSLEHFFRIMVFTYEINNLLFILIYGIVLWGMFYLYKINKAGDNKDFFGRIFSLGFPSFIRFIPFFLLISFLMGRVEGFIGWVLKLSAEALNVSPLYYGRVVHHGAETALIIGVLLAIIIPVWYFRYLGKKLRYVAGATA